MTTNGTSTHHSRSIVVGLATSAGQIREAQELRWKVFSEEQGARLSSPEQGLDIDDLDAYCQHLIARDLRNGSVVGTYRLLTADAARRAGGYYAEREFDLSRIKSSGVRLLELGRSCVLPEYRTGAAITLMWSALAAVLVETRHDALIGCASIPLKPSRRAGALLAHALCSTHAAPTFLRATPGVALPVDTFDDASPPTPMPPLLKGYLRCGAMVCGEPFWDQDFDCADLLLYLSVDRFSARYARRFLPTDGAATNREASSPCHMISV